jgi:hypothetical protein
VLGYRKRKRPGKSSEGGLSMNKKLLLIAAAFTGISGLCIWLARDFRDLTADDDHASDARWANEGGANSPPGV